MSRGDKPAGIVEGVDELSMFETELLMHFLRDGQVDPDEEMVMSRVRSITTGMEEWSSRFQLLCTNTKGFHAPPTVTAIKAREHETVYGFNPLAAD